MVVILVFGTAKISCSLPLRYTQLFKLAFYMNGLKAVF